MSSLEKLKACSSRPELARLLGIKPAQLTYILYKTPIDQRYNEFQIPKASGGQRTICAPNPRLKSLQTRTSNLLYGCYAQIHDMPKNTRFELSHAFQKKRGLSIVSNADKHRNKRFVFNLDFEDFFGSFNFGRVRGYFLSNRHFLLNETIATTLAQICCHDNKLPQGAPTSPIMTELITRILDIRLAKLARSNGCTYSRYADDLTFSTNKPTFPTAIAEIDADGECSIGAELSNKIHTSGFRINVSKTRMQLCDSRQEATGLVVNQKVNISKEYSKSLRSVCHTLFNTGSCYRNSKQGDETQILTKYEVEGRLSHQFYVKSRSYLTSKATIKRASVLKKELGKIPAFYSIYSDFLFFCNFCHNDRPIVLCEGVTDNIYIKSALKTLNSQFPDLVTLSQSKEQTIVELNLNFYSYSRTSVSVTDLTGGSGDIKKFVGTYSEKFDSFKAASLARPVIVVVDNDDANKGLWGILRDKYKLADADGSASFYHVSKNLYVVPIPKKDGSDTIIEHLFDQQTLSLKHEGKSLDLTQKRGSKLPSDKFGKKQFANLIAKNKDKIDFSGFTSLLVNVQEAIATHESKQVPEPKI